MKQFLILAVLSLCLYFNTSCKTNNQSAEEDTNTSYKDGKYCATVHYYNPKTNFRKEYIFEVEVESNKLVKIFFPNGGWLDESHFSPPTINQSGNASFTADNGAKYKVFLYENLMNCSFSKTNPESDELE